MKTSDKIEYLQIKIMCFPHVLRQLCGILLKYSLLACTWNMSECIKNRRLLIKWTPRKIFFREYYQCPEGDSYKIPENMITEGQTCAAIFPEDNNWHRVVVKRIQDESYVEVWFVYVFSDIL